LISKGFLMSVTLSSKFQGCLLGGAIGDSLGMPTEVGPSRKPGETIAETCGVEQVTTYLNSPNPDFLKAGEYTDDTQQTICLAETFLDGNGNFSGIVFAEKLKASIDKKMRGIGPSTKRIFQALSNGQIQNVVLGSMASKYPTNGGTMRIAPVALLYYWDPKILFEKVVEATRITHGHPTSIAGACVHAFMIAKILTSQRETFDISSLRHEVASFIEPIDSEMAEHIELSRKSSGNGCLVIETVPEVLDAFLNQPNDYLTGVLEQVNSDGDTDTKASMIGNLLGAWNGIQTIPQYLINGLENGEKGKDYIVSIADRLLELSDDLKLRT
jgi:ADP-ribosylglycohydrolase